MAIRLPLKTVLSFSDSGDLGANSVAGVVAQTFQIPQDSDGLVVKLTSSIVGGTVSATLQTTDDGGSTWYDVVRTPSAAIVNNTIAAWASAKVVGDGVKTIPGSVLGGAIGSAAASVLAANSASGLPILSPLGRIALIYTGNVTANDGVTCEVKVQSQSATA